MAARSPTGAAALVADLGCGACHTGVPGPEQIRRSAPPLGDAGLRYSPAYLLEYLQKPTPVRRYTGVARMPDFHLDERESLALALFLEAQRRGAAAVPELPGQARRRRRGRDQVEAGRRAIQELGCQSCHTLEGRGGRTALELATVGARLNREWVRQFLAAPQAFDPHSPMPALFYEADGRGGLRPRVPDAAEKLEGVVAYLFSLGQTEQAAPQRERQWERVRERHAGISALDGRRIFVSQNCAGCHRHPEYRGWRNAPDLRREAARVRPDWLRRFLAHPAPVRPFGYYPGSGSRMPDFRLAPAEVDSLAALLSREARGAPGPAPWPPFRPAELSAFRRAKAETLLRDRLPCLGCHALGGAGGRIAPDLAEAGRRLEPRFLYAIIRNPQAAVPGTIMPQHPMPEETLDLIASFLLQRPQVPYSASYLSLLDHPIQLPRFGDGLGALYGRYCGLCHGPRGQADGYNARYLPVRPTVHADGAYMATRPDDTLFDGIYAGGYILGRSHRMPAFGGSLSYGQIRGLVRYLRELCACQGPAWSRG